MDLPHSPNSAALYDARRRRGSVGTSQLFDNIVSASNCQRFPIHSTYALYHFEFS